MIIGFVLKMTDGAFCCDVFLGAMMCMCWKPAMDELGDCFLTIRVLLVDGFGVNLPVDGINGGVRPFVFVVKINSKIRCLCSVTKFIFQVRWNFNIVNAKG